MGVHPNRVLKNTPQSGVAQNKPESLTLSKLDAKDESGDLLPA